MAQIPPSHPIYLDRNENNYGPAPACFDVLRNADVDALSCYTKVHTRGVKSELSERLAAEFGVPEPQVLLGYGAEDLLKQAVQVYLEAGEKLMIPSYSWWYYKEIANEVGGLNVEYPLVKGKESFSYDVEGMLAVYRRERPKAVFISTPNNPTGNSLCASDMERLLDALQDVPVIIDEAYWYNTGGLAVKDVVARHPRVVIMRTFSKYYALAGVRIGFAVIGANMDLLEKTSHRYLGFNRLSERIALAALDSAEYYAGIAQKMKADRELYYSEVGSLPGVTVFRSDANFLLVEIPAAVKDRLKEFLTKRGLILKFMNEPLLNSHIRITLGTREQNRLVIDAIREFFT